MAEASTLLLYILQNAIVETDGTIVVYDISCLIDNLYSLQMETFSNQQSPETLSSIDLY